MYLLIEEGILVGSVALKGNEIDDLLVAPEYQGRGIGKGILFLGIGTYFERADNPSCGRLE